ncbi:hypothetical protein ABG768_023950 [Culter alburnus]|uniref:Uncharacterized protein n=1 Tax=Culter alburnus TaxID=194366 RepID=A0AAW2AHZ5_CULAL
MVLWSCGSPYTFGVSSSPKIPSCPKFKVPITRASKMVSNSADLMSKVVDPPIMSIWYSSSLFHTRPRRPSLSYLHLPGLLSSRHLPSSLNCPLFHTQPKRPSLSCLHLPAWFPKLSILP